MFKALFLAAIKVLITEFLVAVLTENPDEFPKTVEMVTRPMTAHFEIVTIPLRLAMIGITTALPLKPIVTQMSLITPMVKLPLK
jgi:hypothetical protein